MRSRYAYINDEQINNQNKSLSVRYIRVNEEDKHEISMIEKIMIREIIKIDIGRIVGIGEYHSVVEYIMDRITETDQGIVRTIEVISEEEILEGMCNQIRIIEVKIIVVDIEEIIGMIIMKEVGVGLGKDNIQMIPEGMIEVVLGLDQVQGPVPIEIELDAINVGNMIILLSFESRKRSRTNTTDL